MKTTPLHLLNNGHTDLLIMDNIHSNGEQTNIWVTVKDGTATCAKHTFNLLPDSMETEFKKSETFDAVEDLIEYLGGDWAARALYHAIGVIGDDDNTIEITPIGENVAVSKQKPSHEIISSKDATIYTVNTDWQQAIIDDLGAGHEKSKNGYITKSTTCKNLGKGKDAFCFTTIKIQRCQSEQDVKQFFADNYTGLYMCRSLQF